MILLPAVPPTDQEVETEMARSNAAANLPVDVRLAAVEASVEQLDSIIVAVLS